MAFSNEKAFNVSCVGSKTADEYKGSFKCRVVLSQLDEINIDRRRRELLGANPESAGPNAAGRAQMLGEIFVRLIPDSVPKWWKETGDGCLLLDDEPLTEVYNACIKAENDHAKEVKEKAEKAKAVLLALGTPEA